jgi:predicted  nucleic acid-binding Zn-ribbon protein
MEEIEESKRILLTQLDAATQREDELRDEARNLERSMALLRHEIKEAQRKADVELESKKNMENSLQDLKRKLEEEQNKRTREISNNQQSVSIHSQTIICQENLLMNIILTYCRIFNN